MTWCEMCVNSISRDCSLCRTPAWHTV